MISLSVQKHRIVHDSTMLTCKRDVQKGRSKLHIGKERTHRNDVPMCDLGRPFCTSSRLA